MNGEMEKEREREQHTHKHEEREYEGAYKTCERVDGKKPL